MPRLERRSRTADRGPPGERTAVHTVGQIGPKRKLRPDGSLLCEDVPIARTGSMMYAPGEIPLQPPKRPGAAQVLYVTRDAFTLFAPAALGSAVGAPITNEHPTVDVNPANWGSLARGFILDAWRGTGAESDLMFADLVVTDQGSIHKINTGQMREVSLGYAADYEQTGDGEGRQRNIIINHLALVERGRCGPRCAIGDRQPEEEHMPRTTGTNGGPRPRVRLSQETVDALQSALSELPEEDDDDSVHVHVHMGDQPSARTADGAGEDPPATLEERIGDIEGGMLELKELILAQAPRQGTQDATTGDSAALATSFQQFTAHAEILVPGFKAPTFDAALPRAKTVDAMCASRRQVLGMLQATAPGAALIGQVADEDFNVTTSDCSIVASVFKSAAAVRSAANNRGSTGDKLAIPNFTAGQSVVPEGGMKRVTAEEINANNAKFWAVKQP